MWFGVQKIWTAAKQGAVLGCFAILPAPAIACKLALVLAIDVSSSIDAGEYHFQVDGLADALLSAEIGDVLLRDQVALSVVQWSGAGEHEAIIPWRRMLSGNALANFAQRVRKMERKWGSSNTAVGDALAFSIAQFDAVPDCTRRVIDVSGDGASNAGVDTVSQARRAQEMGIQINGLAIDIMGRSITEYYERFVITKNGFVQTSRGFSDYPLSIHKKLLRELIKPGS
ncbi:MAG: DUF1194 domain-containing protein [Paracoccaceae bacterium]